MMTVNVTVGSWYIATHHVVLASVEVRTRREINRRCE
jgi:hypothetical protein